MMKSEESIVRMLEHELGIARKNVESAQTWASRFGHYDDCGSEYESEYTEAKAVCEYLEKLLPRVRELTKNISKNRVGLG